MLQFDDRAGSFLAHILDRILVAEPVGSFDRVVHVPAPVVLPHIAERRANAALRRDRVASRRKYLRDTGDLEPRLGKSEGCAKTGATGSDDDDVVAMIDEFVVAHAPTPILKTAYTAVTATKMCANRESIRDMTLMPGACT